MTNILKNKSLVLILVTPIEKALLASCTPLNVCFVPKDHMFPLQMLLGILKFTL